MELREKVIAINNAGLSEAKIAKLIGLSQANVHYFKSGRNRGIGYEAGVKLAHLYDEIFKKY